MIKKKIIIFFLLLLLRFFEKKKEIKIASFKIDDFCGFFLVILESIKLISLIKLVLFSFLYLYRGLIFGFYEELNKTEQLEIQKLT